MKTNSQVSVGKIFKILFLYSLLIFVFTGTLEAFTSTLEDFRISEIHYTATLLGEEENDVFVTEYVTFEGDYLNDEVWIELPEEEVDGLKRKYTVVDVKRVTFDDENNPDYSNPYLASINWRHYPGNGGIDPDEEEYLSIYPSTYKNKVTIKIDYYIDNAILKYDDCSELYLTLHYGNDMKYLKEFNGEVLIPNELMPSEYDTFLLGTKRKLEYSEDANKNEGYHTFSMNYTNLNLKANSLTNYIEFCLLSHGEDKHIFAKNASDNIYSNEPAYEECVEENSSYIKQSTLYMVGDIICLVLGVLIIIYFINKTKKELEKIKEVNPTKAPSIPYDYFREIPEKSADIRVVNLLVSEINRQKSLDIDDMLSATILSLIHKKCVELSIIDNLKNATDDNIKITILAPETSLLTISEQTVYEFLKTLESRNSVLDNQEELTLSEMEKRISDSPTLVENLVTFFSENMPKPTSQFFLTSTYLQPLVYQKEDYENVEYSNTAKTSYDIFQENLRKVQKNIISRAVTILFIVVWLFFSVSSKFVPVISLLMQVIVICQTIRLILLVKEKKKLSFLNQKGYDEATKWLALRNFLESDTLISERELYELPLWEEFLIYGTAFGISSKVLKALDALDIEKVALSIAQSKLSSSTSHSISRSCMRSYHHTVSSRGGYGGGGGGG